MSSLVILGATGFLGKVLIAQKNIPSSIKAVARKIPSDADLHSERITWYDVDLLSPRALDKVLEKDDIVINTVYINTHSEVDNLRLINNIIDACVRNEVKRLIHCSTAVVVGTAKEPRIDETVTCVPCTQYEKVKFAIEQQVLNAVGKGFEIAILRPTAMVGPHGKNLLKLANSLINGNQLVNYLRASLFGRRRMHLVSVRNVAVAIVHLALLDHLLSGSIYYVSSDDDPENNYLGVEKILLETLGLGARKIPILPVPLLFLSILLKIKGRSESNLARTYDSRKLLATHFVPIDSLYDAVSEFAKSIRNLL
ncbi:Putative NADH-flavin reductase [Legionella lansingensis]|uniref:NAD dependent epimerase/dehydratase family protein n=1 Tax=Legionella lansingensis TaxID=45067 RepID=A0A0W0VW80_9GAMM|nr:NAD(P)-dependent oxidoreductase [Legionella lansingensis]KTD24335.1 NAD dependent epimerase/dehydratase family protein [Legionella lansingensis]SNV51755.1 Putative NADH-flavin reductase [Legionella lansingensis]